MAVSDWSTSAASNGPVEGCSPAILNDTDREIKADVRAAFTDLPWVNIGNGSGTPAYTYVSGTSFSLTGNVTTTYHQYRAIRAVGTLTGTIYGKIASSSHNAGVTTVVVEWNSGSLQSETLTISLGIPATGPPFAFANTTQLADGSSSSLIVTPQKMAQLTDVASPGYIRYPGGLILQYGTATTNGSGTVTVSLAYGMTTTIVPFCAAQGTPAIHVQPSSITINNFVATSYDMAGTAVGPVTFGWWGMGY
jgi:hypothetical protein